MKSIHCCIVDDHCDIVPFIHSCYRSKILSLHPKPPIIYHFDSHADLSVPKSSTKCWYDKESLYELLAQEGGISEFLIPLQYTGYIDDIIWIRPHWSAEILMKDGSYSFLVGDSSVNDGRCGVSLRSNYYIDDAVYCDDESFSINYVPKLCTVALCTIDRCQHLPRDPPYWILDICLDYFSVSNPFLVEVRNAISTNFSSSVNNINLTVDEILQIFIDSFRQLPYLSHVEDNLSSNCILNERNHVLQILFDFLEVKTEYWSDQYFDLMTTCFPTETNLGKKFISAINNLSIDSRLVLRKVGSLLLLPHHIASMDEIDGSIADFIQAVKYIGAQPPLVITIATSADDEYTPKNNSSYLKSKVLKTISDDLLRHWGNCSMSSSLSLEVHDLTLVDDPISAAYSIFLNRKCQQYLERSI